MLHRWRWGRTTVFSMQYRSLVSVYPISGRWWCSYSGARCATSKICSYCRRPWADFWHHKSSPSLSTSSVRREVSIMQYTYHKQAETMKKKMSVSVGRNRVRKKQRLLQGKKRSGSSQWFCFQKNTSCIRSHLIKWICDHAVRLSNPLRTRSKRCCSRRSEVLYFSRPYLWPWKKQPIAMSFFRPTTTGFWQRKNVNSTSSRV